MCTEPWAPCVCVHVSGMLAKAAWRDSGSALQELSRWAVRMQVPYTQAERSYYLFSRWIQLVRANDFLFFEALVSDEL